MVAFLIKKANEKIAVLGRGTQQSKALQVGAFFVSFSPFREPLLPNGSDIAYAVILSSTVILRCSDICPAGKLWINTATSAGSRNIILATAKISL